MDVLADNGRRRVMQIGAAAMVATAAGVMPAPAGARASLDLATEEGRARAYMRMRGVQDDRLTIGGLTGRYYGVVDAELTPLFGVTAATFARFRRLPEGSYQAATFEVAYFTDLTSGRAIDTLVNPYTKEAVAVPSVRSKPARIRITPALDIVLDAAPPGLQFDHRVLPPEQRGDDVWFTEVTRTRAPTPAGATFHYSESTTLHARRSDLERGGVAPVACDTSFTNVVDWRPWLEMAGRPGHMMAVGAGRYGIGVAELPPAWIAATRAQHPDVLTGAEAILEPVWHAR